MKAWEEWGKRNAAAIVATDVMVGKTRRVTKSGIADAQNQIAGFLIVEAADIATAAGSSRITRTSPSSPVTASTSCPT